MMSQEERFEKALEGFAKLLGEEQAKQFRQGLARGYPVAGMKDFTELTMAHAFADVWMRPGLDLKSRSIAMIAGLMAMRQWDELKSHVRIGLRNGLTPDEIMEVLLQMSAYAGLAAGHSAYGVAQQVFRAQGIDQRKKEP
jgi:4-carboxymuconolactone decarboxylase